MMKPVLVSAISALFAFAAIAEDLVYDVAEGQTEEVSTSVDADEAGVSRLIKRGPGSLKFMETVGGTRNFAEMVIEAGEVILGKASDSFKIADITVKGGAKLTAGESGPLVSTAVIDIEKGGTVDFGAYADTIDGIVGAGTLTSSGKVIKLKLTRGPHLFSGLVTGTTILEVENSGSNPDHAFIVGTSNTLAAAKFRMSSGGGTNLLFAAGVGCFEINQVECGANRPLYLHDLAGEPITVFSGIYNNNNADFKLRGAGNWFLKAGSDSSQKNADGTVFAVGLTGDIGVWQASLCIGTQTDAGRTDFSTVRSIGVWNKFTTASDSRLQIYNDKTAEWTYPCPIYGDGIIDFRGPSVLEDFRMSGAKIYAYTNLTFRGGNGGLRETPGIMFKNYNSHIVVTNGAVIGGPFVSKPSLRGSSKLRYHKPFGFGADNNNMYLSSSMEISGRGSTVYQKDTIPYRVSVTDSGTYAIAGALSAGYATAVAPAEVLVDGATLKFSADNGGGTVNLSEDSDRIAFKIGVKGGIIDAELGLPQWTDGNMNCFMQRPFVTGVAEGKDGGLTMLGSGHLRPYYPWTITGPFRFYAGTIDLDERPGLISATGPLFGFGDFEMGGALIRYRDATSSYAVRLGTGEGAKFIAGGAATIRLRESADRALQTVEFGPLTRKRGGALLLMSDVAASKGAFDPATVGTARAAGGTELSANGRILYPAFSCVNATEDTYYRVGFLTYDAANNRFAGLENQATELEDGKVCWLSTVGTNVAAGTTVSVEALRIDGKTLTLESGSTLKIGDGTNPACLILNPVKDGISARITGDGTVDFGTSEGVVVVGRSTAEPITATIAGENGLTIVGPVDARYETLTLSGANTYAGPTYISGAYVCVNNDQAFSTSVVHCVAGDVGGGGIWFNQNAGRTLANDLKIAGCGSSHGDGGHYGAVCAESGENRLTGAVEVTSQARVTALAGTSITFTGVISGTRLQFFDSKGDIILSAANTYTNGTEVTRSTLTLRGSGTVGTGDVLLDGGTIVFEDDTAANFANRVDGVGTLVVKDRKTVANFTNLDSEYDGLALGLADKRCTVGSLNGFSSVTNLTAAAADLYVLDGSASSFAGKVSANVTLHDGARVPPGMILIVR